MVLHDAYHIYTVDQHSLKLIQEIERLKAGEHKEGLPLLTQLARDADKIELLYLGLMFHDIGKGFGGDTQRSAPAWCSPSRGACVSTPTTERWWNF